MVNVGFAIASEFVTNFFADKNIFRWINVGFVIIYIIEATLKVNWFDILTYKQTFLYFFRVCFISPVNNILICEQLLERINWQHIFNNT